MSVAFVSSKSFQDLHAHYLDIQTVQGQSLYHQSFSSKEELKKEFDSLYASQKSASSPVSVYSLIYPRYSATVQEFFQSLFLPITRIVMRDIDHRMTCIALSIFSLLLDLVTTPIRLVTAIPSLLYKAVKGSEDSKILQLIQDHPLFKKVVRGGKVQIKATSEHVPKIQFGNRDGCNTFQIYNGKKRLQTAVIPIRPSFFGSILTVAEPSFHGYMNPNILKEFTCLRGKFPNMSIDSK